MSEVYADGELVTFEGPPPSSPGQIYELLMAALSEKGRAVTKFVVDGVDLLKEEGEAPETFEKIEVTSLTHQELTLRVIRESLQAMDNLADELRAYAQNILILGWSEIFRRMQEFIARIQPFADLLDNLGPYAGAYTPEWGNGLAELAKTQADSLERILKCFEAGDSSGLSDEVALEFAPLFERCRKFLMEEAVIDLEKRVGEAAA